MGMRDLEELLCKAVPRLKKDDRKAQKLRARLIKLGGSYWRKGPRRLKRLGVDPKRYRPLDADLSGVVAGLPSTLVDRYLTLAGIRSRVNHTPKLGAQITLIIRTATRTFKPGSRINRRASLRLGSQFIRS